MKKLGQLGIKDAFERYGAQLCNVQWSVSAWTPTGELVVSLWQHHYRKGRVAGVAEFAGNTQRWNGPGCSEFRENVAKAFREQANVRLVIASTCEIEHVESGKDATKIKKEFHLREDLIGKVYSFNGDEYVFQFIKY